MTSVSFPAKPQARLSWLHLVSIQFGLIARSGRWIELIGGAAVLYVVAEFGPAMGNSGAEGRAWGQWAIYCLLLVAVWPSLLWRGEPVGRRYYHWSLPVPRGTHDLARIAAGGLWVLVVVGMLALSARVSLWPLAMRANSEPLFEIVEYGVGVLTLYAVASVLTLVTAHPARWFFGTLAVYLLLWAPMSIAPVPRWLFRAWGAPVVGRYGLFWATLGAGSSGDIHTEESPNAETTWGGDKYVVTVTGVETSDSTGRPGSPTTERTIEQIEFPAPHWRWAASVAWLAGSIGAMLLISARRRER
jgi:hypothetical protein